MFGLELETLFSLCGTLAMLGWLGLALLPGQRVVVEVIARLAIPTAIGVVYVLAMLLHSDQIPADGGFGSLAAVKSLFQIDGLLLGGWVHYLAFDLFVGSWEVSDARSRGIAHWWVIPCLFATFLAGPAGLVLYLLVVGGHRLVAGRQGEVAA